MLLRLPAALWLLWLVVLGIPRLATADTSSPQLLHAPWGELLARHAQSDGQMNYELLLEHEGELQAYLEAAKRTPPQPGWSSADQAAYWLNVYNAATVYLTLQYYPVATLSEIRIKTTGGNRSVWDAPEVNVGGKLYSLNQIERDILPRLLPNDPRLHFALTRGARSGPVLLAEAYDGSKLEQQLSLQARRFINDPLRNQLSAKQVQVSSLFDWYAAEFGSDNAGLIRFLNRYAQTPIEPTATVGYLPFDWTLNHTNAPAQTAQRISDH